MECILLTGLQYAGRVAERFHDNQLYSQCNVLCDTAISNLYKMITHVRRMYLNNLTLPQVYQACRRHQVNAERQGFSNVISQWALFIWLAAESLLTRLRIEPGRVQQENSTEPPLRRCHFFIYTRANPEVKSGKYENKSSPWLVLSISVI